ncbi:hypothetical protein BH09PSE1_BH09PSE1_24250 [soil metagenome]
MGERAARKRPGLPQPAAARLAALAEGLRPPADPATFADPARLAAIAVADRIRAETRSGELTEALAVLVHLRAGLGRLDPAALATRRGLSGLFDSRNRRLKAFRARFAEATRTLSESLDDLQVRITAMSRRSSVLDRLWTELREAILDLDACAALALHPSGSEAHVTRGHRLADARDAALRILPSIRVAQNADAQALLRLRLVCDALIEWNADWTQARCMKGRKPKKIRPDLTHLSTSRETVMAMVDAAAREAETARSRRVEEDGRMDLARRRI